MELGFYAVFRWLVSFNPPPWNPDIILNQVSATWINAIILKHTITAYILLLASQVMLNLGPVRSFFRLKARPGQQDLTVIYVGAVLMGLVLWTVDSLVDCFAFHPDKTFWSVAIWDSGPHEMFMRLLYMIMLLMGAIAVARFTRQRALLREHLNHKNRILIAIRKVNKLIMHEKDRDRLLGEACRLLIETREYHNALIILVEDSKPVEPFLHAGFDGAFAPMAERLRTNPLPHHACLSLDRDGVQVMEDPHSQCTECPLAAKYEGRVGLITRLEHAGRIFGWMTVSASEAYARDKEEQGLFGNVAADIAFALWAIENEEQKSVPKRRGNG